MDSTDRIKQEMTRWSAESRDRHYFEVKINSFLKSEITRLENEVMGLRLENQKLQTRIDDLTAPKKQVHSGSMELEID